jgi:hypothetical protein
MVTRDQFLMRLRKLARQQNKTFLVLNDAGKGSHYRIIWEGRKTTLKSGELDPGYVRLVMKQLGIVENGEKK